MRTHRPTTTPTWSSTGSPRQRSTLCPDAGSSSRREARDLHYHNPMNPRCAPPVTQDRARAGARRRPGRLALLLACLGLLFAIACSRAQPFVPGERVTAISVHGYLAAEYELPQTGGSADIKVWSRGTSHEDLRGARETFAHVAFEIDNQTQHPMHLQQERLLLQSVSVDDVDIGPLPPALIDGTTTVGPGGEQLIHVWFALPNGIAPRHVHAFRVAWTLTDGTTSYSQRTPFLQEQANYYYSPYYDPFVYPMGLHRGLIIHRQPYYHHYGPARRWR